jgi:putative ABC transport system ATP-binding protein
MNNSLLINCQQIKKSYPLGNTHIDVLNNIDLKVNYGEHIAILGPSGSGKSTLMNILGCLDTPSSGQYFLAGKEVSHLTCNELADIRNHKVGFVFQSFNLLAHATALENVALPLVYRGTNTSERHQRAKDLLTQVGLADRLHHLPSELSGGQRQRVAIARALVTDPDLILADEPTGNLDSQSGNEVMQLFESLVSKGKTVLIVTHDLNLAKRTQRIIYIQDGKIAENTM